MATIRIYGKVVNKWYDEWRNGTSRLLQVEVAYKDYNDSGELVGTGTEDFSAERWNKQTRLSWVYVWDGTRYNRGGKRWWECIGIVRHRVREGKLVKSLYKAWAHDWELIELR